MQYIHTYIHINKKIINLTIKSMPYTTTKKKHHNTTHESINTHNSPWKRHESSYVSQVRMV